MENLVCWCIMLCAKWLLQYACLYTHVIK
uniref:Uncharacterized protein n=1 Tax=Rhizophora mucronata TaxID=61149 RepID=A0A2P2NHQ5_RHIMU